MKILNISILLFLSHLAFAQNYTSYFTGNSTDLLTSPSGGVCLMGGASEHDEAMKWFLNKANGGDILVLRASGSNGYNNYMYSQLGVTINSVESIVCHNQNSANETYIHDKINKAEAIWFAGGDQWNYISYWRNTAVDSLINLALQTRNIAIGGTSAGMAILGGYYFSAENGTISSSTALQNPYDANATVDSADFIQVNYMSDVITDTHYDNPDRRGRHASFLARILTDNNSVAKGIACDEYVAVCIDTNGIARVYGDYPAYDEDAYFIQPNCEWLDMMPETCLPNQPLTWDLNNSALKAYRVKGTMAGVHTFDLNDWQTGSGGAWEDWSVVNGVLSTAVGSAINCNMLSVNDIQTKNADISVFPNPFSRGIEISMEEAIYSVELLNICGQILYTNTNIHQNFVELDFSYLPNNIYILKISSSEEIFYQKIVKH